MGIDLCSLRVWHCVLISSVLCLVYFVFTEHDRVILSTCDFTNMSVSETTKLLEETRAIVYEHSDMQSEEGNITLSSIHSLLTQMNTKLSNIELKNNALDSRLTVIETKMSSLDEIQGTLSSMKWHYSRLEEEVKDSKKDFQSLEGNVKALGDLFDTVKEETRSNQKAINSCKKDAEQSKNFQKSTEFELQAVKEVNASLQESVTDLKARSMRDNLVFTGIREERWEDTEQVLLGFLQNKYKLDYRVDFERVHRMGKWSEFSVHPRKIVAKFTYFKDREYIRINAAKRLKGSGVYVNEQFPPEIEEKRKKLYPLLRQAKKENKRAKLVRDILYIDGKEHTPQESAPGSASSRINRTPNDRKPKRARSSSTPDSAK